LQNVSDGVGPLFEFTESVIQIISTNIISLCTELSGVTSGVSWLKL